ncbi:fibronectin-binding protein A N-terminus-domain-containing protein [Halteromyces radiatus]|uniref:fibronectin-binding protein A N-terminus-domain-containing protein n=1 Tax=Halteromyces radiatus TaxID=101107 RepID=UPI00221FD4CC|nr:fibronectin-binding protein A N-terminus-domain-containing protein [Halteromyces radiatus]KAI8086191.1 fibronectin-binding protein A N-terminus-domain-containing protein [Halteromyces radiatus]
MKQRFNALDIRATVANLKERLIGLRLQNVYDVNSKTFLFKFGKPDDKELVLIESGTRIHTTQFSREKSAMPSMFCAKLRKHIRTRRLTGVRQVGVDRIVDFEFGGGENSLGFHIIAEFYASGNIILTDHEYRILTLLRVVQSDTVRMVAGEIYNIDATLRDFQKVEVDKLKQVLQKAGPKDTLKKILNIGFEYGPAMTEHIILEAGLNPNTKVATEFDCSDDSPALKDLLVAFTKSDEMVASTANKVPKGYIILLDNANQDRQQDIDGKELKEVEIYDEFHPYLYHQHATKKYLEFPTFDSAVDEFYSAIEAQKLEMKARNQENAAIKKLEAVRKEQEGRVAGLLDQQMSNTRKAQLIELNLDTVDAAISIIRNAVASQMDWLDLEELVKEEKRRNNPIALMIDALKLKTNQITLLLSDPYDNEDSDDSDDNDDDENSDDSIEEKRQQQQQQQQQLYKVDVDISTTAFANARVYYDMKKTTAVKHEKTIAATSKALKSAERKIRQDLKETKINVSINKIRKPFWFEKFLWFISTEGYLIIAGRDMQQNEILVKRYLLKGDVYVHADLHGAASVVVKNKPDSADKPIPPSTLFQAGIMSVCQSKAWDAKIVTSAYWVHPDQVSKSAPTGEYLTTGSFMIRGKKNFLPPVQLVYGFGYLFKLDESSIGNHINEKRQELEQDGDQDDNQEIKEDHIEANIQEEEQEGAIMKSVKDVNIADDDDDDSSDSSSSDNDETAFPDTQLTTPSNVNEVSPNTANGSTKDKEWNKYDLEEYGENDDTLPSFAQNQPSDKSQSKKAISAKERRDMKKGTKGTGSGNNTPKLDEFSSQPKPNKKPSNNNKANEPKQQPVSTRGRKGKSKKIKEKYGDQDEEERQLRMEILGSNKGPQPKGKKAKKQAKEKAEKLAMEKEREERRKQRQAEESTTTDDIVDTNKTKDSETLHDNAKETEDIRQMLKEENITMLENEELASLTSLDSLTANPLPNDLLHFAIPVCAPYPALQKYKYKVKLTPGTLKRGKAIKQAQSVFLNHQDITAREKELIKGVPDMEAINTMMSKVKVSAPNLEASKKKKGGRR